MFTKRAYEKIFKGYGDVVSIKDVQKMLGIGKNLAYKLICEQKIKSVKAGRKYIIAKESVIEYLVSTCPNHK